MIVCSMNATANLIQQKHFLGHLLDKWQRGDMKRIGFRISNCFLRTLILASWVLLPAIASTAEAIQPPEQGGRFPDAYFDRARVDLHAFTYKRALHDVAARAIIAREAAHSPIFVPLGLPGPLSIELGKLLGAAVGEVPSTKVQGVRNVPVLPSTFKSAVGSPYAIRQLQRELFDRLIVQQSHEGSTLQARASFSVSAEVIGTIIDLSITIRELNAKEIDFSS